jgi:DNA topoisomerase I
MQLIIVESPTKAKTISKFLDRNYLVTSSYGHIRDLPIKKLGVDVENNFQPEYEIPLKAKKTINELKSKAKKADSIILATDEDREGEAIAWHLKEALSLNDNDYSRIVFHEITKEAILKALSGPQKIDQNLVDAQQARRILDRLVGYKLSPFLYKKVARGLSAGRVQSVAVRLIVEREREIKDFKAEEYWSLTAFLKKDNDICQAELNKVNNKIIPKLKLNKDLAEKSSEELKKAKFNILEISSKETTKNPPPPFTTSSLQQSANRMLGYSAKQTMMIAQKLYEKGYITYMRTDSLNLSNNFLIETKEWLKENQGEKFYLENPRRFKNKSKGAQEAHEAIRPTKAKNDPEKLNEKIDKKFLPLYRLIWQRAIASQMPNAILNLSSIEVEAKYKNTYTLKANGQILVFPGYLKVYPEKTKEQILPKWQKNDELFLEKLETKQHFTKGPARYSDAGLVKEMEKHGIGRPSTYAPTISTIIARNYVDRDEAKRLYPTDIAFVVNDLLVNHFKNIVDFNFTAEMEENLDNIALGKKPWVPIINDFYIPFIENLKIKNKELEKSDIIPEEKSQEKCDKCGADMLIKTGRYGKFLACSAYPECKNIKSLNKKASPENDEELNKLQDKHQGKKCDKCGADMEIKKGRFGPFLACNAYPKCKNIKSIDDELNIDCPKCNKGKIVKKFSKRGVFYACNNYPECKNLYNNKPTNKKCSKCDSLLIEKNSQTVCSNKECSDI